MSEVIEVELRPEREIFYKNDFGIYGVITENDDIKLEYNKYKNVTIKGSMPKLEVGVTYKAKLKRENHPKYGVSYKVESIFQDLPTNTSDQKRYLETILTENQVKAIYDFYNDDEDIIGMMKSNTFNYNNVNGFGDTTYPRIKNKVLNNIEIQEALVELSKYGLKYNVISRLVEKYGSAKLLVQKISENVYLISDEIDGFGFKKVDAIAMKTGVDKESQYRIESALTYYLKEQGSRQGHCWVSLKDTVKDVSKLLDVSSKKVHSFIKECDNKKFKIEDDRIGLYKVYFYESEIAKKIDELLSAKSSVITGNVAKRISETEEKQGFKFTDEQRKAIELAVKENVVVINGKAGVGKSASLKGILNALSGNWLACCALSGKAANRIEEMGIKAYTIHRLLEWIPNRGFKYGADKFLKARVIVLDEASMVDSWLFYHLITSIAPGSKFIILGDSEQLEAIGVGGSILKDMIDSKKVPTVELTKVHRQAMKSGILSTANQVRDGIQFNDKDDYENRRIGELQDLHFRPYKNGDTVYKSLINVCKQYKGNTMDFQVIVPKKQGVLGVKNLNNELQEIFNPGEKDFIERNGYKFKEGDKIIQSGNNYDHEVFNGTLGIIKEINKNKMFIKFVGIENLVEYEGEYINKVELAYALTCHRGQGSGFKNVVVAFDYSSYILLSKQWTYTSLTRAEKTCVLICENKALRYSIATDKGSQRNTYLKQLLINELN